MLALVAGFSRAFDRISPAVAIAQIWASLRDRQRPKPCRQSSIPGRRRCSASLPAICNANSDDWPRRTVLFLVARDFFARLIQKLLEYYISRELPNYIGPNKSLRTIDRQIEFRGALERHCREAALIVEAFAGGWYSKINYQGTLIFPQPRGSGLRPEEAGQPAQAQSVQWLTICSYASLSPTQRARPTSPDRRFVAYSTGSSCPTAHAAAYCCRSSALPTVRRWSAARSNCATMQSEGSFSAWYFEHRLPVAPERYGEVLRTVVKEADGSGDGRR